VVKNIHKIGLKLNKFEINQSVSMQVREKYKAVLKYSIAIIMIDELNNTILNS